MAEQNLSFKEAVARGLAVGLSRSTGRTRYWTILGDGDINEGKRIASNEVFKDEAFWRSKLDEFQKVANVKGLERVKTTVSSAKTTIQRESGRQKAATARTMRAAGGLLAGAASPNLGAESSSVGPMLGGSPNLGGTSTLGNRRVL
jgi:hypothetical protein